MCKMPTISVTKETHRALVKAKATLELQEETLISMNELISRMLEEFPKIDLIWESEEEEQPTRSQPSLAYRS